MRTRRLGAVTRSRRRSAARRFPAALPGAATRVMGQRASLRRALVAWTQLALTVVLVTGATVGRISPWAWRRCGSGLHPQVSSGHFRGELDAEEPGHVRDGVIDLRRRVVAVVVRSVSPHEFLLTLKFRVEAFGLVWEGAPIRVDDHRRFGSASMMRDLHAGSAA